jgi:hypothetical protein
MRVGNFCEAKRKVGHIEFMGGLLLLIVVGSVIVVVLTLTGWWG